MPKAYQLPAPGEPFDPELFKLGAPCKRNHIHADGMTLRWVRHKTCCICSRTDALERQQRLRQDPEHLRKQAAYVAEKRKREGRPSRAKHTKEWHELRSLRWAIQQSGRLPTVAQLVSRQQLDYWQDHPAEHLQYKRDRAREISRWRFMTSLQHRLYHRAKSKARKVAQRGGTPHHLTPSHLLRRWGEFNHACAYCGATGDLQIEHVVPISKGGEHHLGNIVPACQRCNFSKGKADVEPWFRTQPFFTEQRWLAICLALDKGQPDMQLELFNG